MFKIDLPKDFERKLKALESLEKELPYVKDAMARNAAFYYRRKIKEAINAQDLDWEELSPKYKAWKKRMGYDERIWIARGILRKNLKVVRFSFANYAVTVPPGAEYPEGIRVRNVLLIQEFGTADGRIPARPLFRPVRQQVTQRLIREVQNANRRIVRALTKDHNLGDVKAIAPEWLED